MSVSRTSVWLNAFRLHTLPLALACIALGNFIAYADKNFHPLIATLTFLTAICLQILSNLANDYGDTRHGADSAERQGPKRMVQMGMISQEEIKRAIIIFIGLCLLCGCLLLWLSIENIGVKGAMALFLLGLVAIAAAIAYTATKTPYGYKGLGDISVFIFFGLLGVYGSYFLQTGFWRGSLLLPAAGMGLLCAGVLNVNNVRDIEADEQANKRTVAVRLGLFYAKLYHWFLLVTGFVLFAIYLAYRAQSPYQYLFLLPGILFLVNAIGITKSHKPVEINPYLKQLVISILLFSLAYGISLVAF